MRGESLFFEKKCEICGKLLYPTGEWAYKIRKPLERTKYYCSWTHYRQGLRIKQRKRVYKRYDNL